MGQWVSCPTSYRLTSLPLPSLLTCLQEVISALRGTAPEVSLLLCRPPPGVLPEIDTAFPVRSLVAAFCCCGLSICGVLSSRCWWLQLFPLGLVCWASHLNAERGAVILCVPSVNFPLSSNSELLGSLSFRNLFSKHGGLVKAVSYTGFVPICS